MKKAALYFLLVAILPVTCASLNSSSIENSPQYDSSEKRFVNKNQSLLDKNREKMSFFTTGLRWLKGVEDGVPNKKLPEILPRLDEFMSRSTNIKVIWFGHSSFLLNVNGKIIFVDPIFSDSASPLWFFVKRFQPPVMPLEDLPPVDFVLISHDHYDHLDKPTIKFFRDKDVKFIVPLRVGKHLSNWGIKQESITELDWWAEKSFSELKFIAAPAQHFSGRTGFDNNETLWASWVIKSEEHSIYFSGDSGYADHFKAIGSRLGPFDLAFIENGQYNESWRPVHLFPEEGAKAYFDLKAKAFFPIHWGMYELAFHTWFEPAVKIKQLADEKNIRLITPKIGEVVELSESLETSPWWEQFIK